jgi:KaiC/GvpD/RAD55 family RecA-like ATPase
LSEALEDAIRKTGAKIVIIDNITHLKTGIVSVKDALSLTKELKALNNKHSLFILILAHTPKRDSAKP